MRTYIVAYTFKGSRDEQHHLAVADALWSCGTLLPFFDTMQTLRILESEMTAAQISERLVSMFEPEDELLIAGLYMPNIKWGGLVPVEVAIKCLGSGRI